MKCERSLGFIIGVTNAKMKNNLAKALKPHNVTPEQWALLIQLWKQDGITQKELSEKILKDQPTTARILDKLEKRGLICRQTNPEDRRAFLIYLTSEGSDSKSALIESARQALAEALQGISDEDQAQLRSLLNRIRDNLS